MENLALLKRGTDRAVQTVLQVEVALPLHDVREQVAVERRILGEEGFEVQVALGGHQLIEADRARRDIRPLPGAFPAVVGIRPPISDALEDHTESLPGKSLRAQPRGRTAMLARTPQKQAFRNGAPMSDSESTAENAGVLPEPAREIAAGYAASGAALDLGALLWDGICLPDVQIRIPLAMLNRHGLVAGATGTGKTKTLQLIAEQLSANGVPVFLADIKGDVSGIAAPGTPGDRVAERAGQVGQEWQAEGFPCEFYALGGIGPGIPLRATVTSFGPVLLSKVLELNQTQEQSLGLIFHYADSKGLELVDLKDLRAVVAFLVSDTGKAELKGIGGLSTATAGVILRSITAFEQQGAGDFFGEPEFDTAELLRQAPDGRGLVSVLELAAVQDKPQLFSTLLMWLLADLFHDLPEVGDLDRPKLVFFFDEAHLLFDGASKAFLESITRTVRLIRSKGIGIFFVTQTPRDVPAGGAGTAREPGSARAARFYPGRCEGVAVDGEDIPQFAVRPGGAVDAAGHRRGRDHGAERERRADAGRRDPAAGAEVADGAVSGGGTRLGREGIPAVRELCAGGGPGIGVREAERWSGGGAAGRRGGDGGHGREGRGGRGPGGGGGGGSRGAWAGARARRWRREGGRGGCLAGRAGGAERDVPVAGPVRRYAAGPGDLTFALRYGPPQAVGAGRR